MKTIALLTGSFPPVNIVGALRPFRLAKHLGRAGWRVLVMTHPPKPEQSLDKELLNELDPSCEILYVTRPENVQRKSSQLKRRALGTTREYLQKIIRPDLDVLHIPAFISAFRTAFQQQAVDVLLTTSPTHSIHLAGLFIKKQFNLPWIVDFRDPWDDYIITGSADIRHPVERYLEKKVVRNASALISTTKTYSRILSNRHPDVDRDIFFTVTNSFCSEKIPQDSVKSKDKFIICYTGIFYPSKDPYEFFRALCRWFDKLPLYEREYYRSILEIHLIGSGDRATREIIKKLNLNDIVVFFDRMPHIRAIEHTCNADMTLISTGLGEKTRPGWLPSKLFEYLGARVPILALIREGEMAEIIRQTNSGFIVNDQIDDNLEKIIKKHIDYKFRKHESVSLEEDMFQNIDTYEESNTMRKFISIIKEAN
ncbi:glycosyltransferase [Desulfobulbus rhabdoformis]|uniref:glycosyltransferase n=1 Tax=Desulfobulbus rhabdoformis TaxID=34032 RepID=UPI001964BD50|nr:glycosyltransferase [Desulfobulbus rhabdoformis]MBM9616714.1 glycosyltransferase [Desulfobulbus rhabdoformis]